MLCCEGAGLSVAIVGFTGVILAAFVPPCSVPDTRNTGSDAMACFGWSVSFFQVDLDARRIRWSLRGAWFEWRPLSSKQGPYSFAVSLYQPGQSLRSFSHGVAVCCGMRVLCVRS